MERELLVIGVTTLIFGIANGSFNRDVGVSEDVRKVLSTSPYTITCRISSTSFGSVYAYLDVMIRSGQPRVIRHVIGVSGIDFSDNALLLRHEGVVVCNRIAVEYSHAFSASEMKAAKFIHSRFMADAENNIGVVRCWGHRTAICGTTILGKELYVAFVTPPRIFITEDDNPFSDMVQFATNIVSSEVAMEVSERFKSLGLAGAIKRFISEVDPRELSDIDLQLRRVWWECSASFGSKSVTASLGSTRKAKYNSGTFSISLVHEIPNPHGNDLPPHDSGADELCALIHPVLYARVLTHTGFTGRDSAAKRAKLRETLTEALTHSDISEYYKSKGEELLNKIDEWSTMGYM